MGAAPRPPFFSLGYPVHLSLPPNIVLKLGNQSEDAHNELARARSGVDRGMSMRSGNRESSLSILGIPAGLVADTLDEALAHGDLIVIGAPHHAFVDIRRRLTASQSFIDLAACTLEASPILGQ